MVVKSAPAGGGTTIGPMVTNAILTAPPTIRPPNTPSIFLSNGFIVPDFY
jgi:hypothetical protein